MHKMSLFAVAAAVIILVGFAGYARVEAPVRAERIDPSKITMNAKDLPTEEFVDYSFVFE